MLPPNGASRHVYHAVSYCKVKTRSTCTHVAAHVFQQPVAKGSQNDVGEDVVAPSPNRISLIGADYWPMRARPVMPSSRRQKSVLPSPLDRVKQNCLPSYQACHFWQSRLPRTHQRP